MSNTHSQIFLYREMIPHVEVVRETAVNLVHLVLGQENCIIDRAVVVDDPDTVLSDLALDGFIEPAETGIGDGFSNQLRNVTHRSSFHIGSPKNRG
jgi:hypothetical protein